MSNEDDKVDSNTADDEEWSTVEKPSKANRRLAPQNVDKVRLCGKFSVFRAGKTRYVLR